MPTIYGVDPDETWEIDYCVEALKLRIEDLREARPAPAKALAEAEQELAQYVSGSGPIFRVGHAPAVKSYELMGMAAENVRKAISAEKLREVFRWEREMVRWTVRAHKNLLARHRDGSTVEVPFEPAEATAEEAKRAVVSDRTLEVYAASGMLGPLARMVADSMRLTEREKNA